MHRKCDDAYFCYWKYSNIRDSCNQADTSKSLCHNKVIKSHQENFFIGLKVAKLDDSSEKLIKINV